jgi:hypothetical protein
MARVAKPLGHLVCVWVIKRRSSMKQAYKIENKPVTPVERNGHGPTRYPFNKMKVGQSFWLEAGVQNTHPSAMADAIT